MMHYLTACYHGEDCGGRMHGLGEKHAGEVLRRQPRSTRLRATVQHGAEPAEEARFFGVGGKVPDAEKKALGVLNRVLN